MLRQQRWAWGGRSVLFGSALPQPGWLRSPSDGDPCVPQPQAGTNVPVAVFLVNSQGKWKARLKHWYSQVVRRWQYRGLIPPVERPYKYCQLQLFSLKNVSSAVHVDEHADLCLDFRRDFYYFYFCENIAKYPLRRQKLSLHLTSYIRKHNKKTDNQLDKRLLRHNLFFTPVSVSLRLLKRFLIKAKKVCIHHF